MTAVSGLEIKINKEYQDLVPLLTDQEYESLRQSIKNEGYWKSEPIKLNSDGIVLDGHHRYKICQELGIEPTTKVMSFNDPLEEKLYVINCNLKRRQLSIAHRVELGHTLKPLLEEKARRNKSLTGIIYGKGKDKCDRSVSNDTHLLLSPVGRVNDVVAKEVGISASTYHRGETVLEQNPQLWNEKVKTGKMTINKALRKHQKEQRRQLLIDTKPVINLPENTSLIHGEFQEKGKEIPDNSIDLIFTDPPYGYDDLYLYEELGKFANRVLKEGGSLVTYVGSIVFAEIFNHLRNSGLNFWWQIIVAHTGGTSFMHPKKVAIRYKPLFWFTKGKKLQRSIDYMPDLVVSEQPDKSMHKWAQSPVEAIQIINYLSMKSDVVCDPMMGSGTTGIAALQLKRQFVGIEKELQSYMIARSQIAKLNGEI